MQTYLSCFLVGLIVGILTTLICLSLWSALGGSL
jgi:xanthosine utilization system XapX-like protein